MALVLSGTSGLSAVLALAYELLVAALGWFAYGLVVPGDQDQLRRAAVAWPLGVAIELIAFAALATLGTRWPLLPAMILLAALALWLGAKRRTDGDQGSLLDAIRSAPAAGLTAFSLLFVSFVGILAAQFLAPNPLPGSVSSVFYPPDISWHMSLVGELANRWPPSDPNVVGDPLRYHYLSHLHMAAVSQATGVDVPVVSMRTFFIAPTLSLMLGFLAAGRSFGRGPFVGIVAIGLFLISGELDFDALREGPFGGLFISDLWLSPSLTLAVPVFLAVIAVMLRGWREGNFGLGQMTVLILLAMLGEGAKGSLLPVLITGLGLMIFWNVAVTRRLPTRAQLSSLGALAFAFVAIYLLLFSGGGGGFVGVDPGAFVDSTVLSEFVTSKLTRGVYALVALGLMMVPLVGGIWLLIYHRRWSDPQKLLFACFVAGVMFVIVVSARGGSQLYFLRFGQVTGLLLAASGLLAINQRVKDHKSERLILGVGFGLGLVLAGFGVLATAVKATPIPAAQLFHMTAAIVALIAFGALVAVLVSRPGARIRVLVLFAIAGALGASSLDIVVDSAAPRLKAYPEVQYAVPNPPATRGLTAGIYEGLEWTREHTPVDAILAVSNQDVYGKKDANGNDVEGRSRYFLYAGLSERRTFIGGWDYSQSATEPGAPATTIVPRLKASRALLRSDSCPALRAAAAAVPASYALYDKVNSPVPEGLRRLVEPSFDNDDVAIYDVRAALDDCVAGSAPGPSSEPIETNRGP